MVPGEAKYTHCRPTSHESSGSTVICPAYGPEPGHEIRSTYMAKILSFHDNILELEINMGKGLPSRWVLMLQKTGLVDFLKSFGMSLWRASKSAVLAPE
jgi:hypothetical protein